MKWEILFVLLFVLLPLLQALLGRGGEPPRLPSPEDAREEHDEFAGAPPLPVPLGPEPAWDEDDHVPGLMARRERPADEEDRVPGLLARRERPAPPPETLDAPVVVSLEPLAARPAPLRVAYDVEPSRSAEHARFHRRTAVQARPERRPSEPRLSLRGVGELRRAVLLGEVLGPPRSLRTLEDDER